MQRQKTIYRLYAWLLLLLFGGSVVGNALHVHFSDCEHFHEFGRVDQKKTEKDHSLPISIGEDAVGNLLLVDCQWGDFTGADSVKPISASFSFHFTGLVAPCNAHYQSPSIQQALSSETLRGPPIS